jgi:hypothetical protein
MPPADATPRQRRIVNVEPTTCPRRIGELGPWQRAENLDHWQRGRWAATQAEADAEVADFMARNPRGGIGNVLWCYAGEQPRTCSFCGGAHPEDVIALLRAGWTVDGTDKAYKRYLDPPGYRASVEAWLQARQLGLPDPAIERVPAPVPPVKVYVQHFTADQIERFDHVLRGDR